MHRTLLPILFAATSAYAAEADPMVSVYEQMYAALEQKVEALEKIEQPSDAAAAVEPVRSALAALKELLTVDQQELWLFIDNTRDKKQALIDLLDRLALQYSKLETSGYYGNAELKEMLAPQIEVDTEAEHAKREKVHAVDHDED